MKPLNCPICGRTPRFTYSTHNGHGDSGFDHARMQCACGVSFGNFSQWGSPTEEDKQAAIEYWNQFVRELKAMF